MPYILNSATNIKEMLEVLEINSLEQLYSHLPQEIKLKKPLDLTPGLTELQARKSLENLSCQNRTIDQFNSFLGAGCYDHYVPSALLPIISRTEFLTAYTPYQPESSQGALQAIYEYQSYICLLTGMDVSNASLFDGASAAAEAILMALRLTGRKKVLVSSCLHPEYKQTIETYLSGFAVQLKYIPLAQDGFIDEKFLNDNLDEATACVIIQSPNFFGLIENMQKISQITKTKQALSIMVTNPLSLALLKAPADLGVDIVCGDGQPLGNNLNFGGSSFGFLAAKKEYLRQIPGRIIGKTVDKDNQAAYCLTLQTREQHIRREKATSNICSNQSLNAIAAAIYLALMGKQGIVDAALSSLNLTNYLCAQIKQINGIKVLFGKRFFNEFVWEIAGAKKIIDKLYKKNIIAGYWLGRDFPEMKNAVLSCCTETKTKKDIDDFVAQLKMVIEKM